MAEAALADTEDQVVETAADDAAQDAPPAAEPTVADIAAEMGWSPKEQWRGAPDKWKPAAEFIKTTVDINRTQSRELKSLKTQVDRIASTSAAIAEETIARRLAEAEARHAEAVEAGDRTAARRASQDIDKLEAKRADATGDPEAEFAAANPWYEKHDEATAYAVAISQRLARQGKPVPDQLEAAEAGVRKAFPELFADAKPAPKAPPAVNGPTTRTAAPSNRAKGVNDLPPGARKSGEMFVQKGLIPDLAAYAKSYWAENPA